jgi:PHD finger-like domain-containing protein 5A
MARHQSDLIFCRRLPGIAVGKVCATCDGRCPSCHSLHFLCVCVCVFPIVLIRSTQFATRLFMRKRLCGYAMTATTERKLLLCVCVCQSKSNECKKTKNTHRSSGRCIVCGGVGVADAYYCRECVALEKDRDGCPKIINVGQARLDAFYDKKAKASHQPV